MSNEATWQPVAPVRGRQTGRPLSKTPALRNTDASAVHTAAALELQVAPRAVGARHPPPGELTM
jgi:hypothetical protein